MRQADIMLATEGDKWLARNRAKLGQRDPVSEMLEQQNIEPRWVLEIGCANGWRLHKLKDKYGCAVAGVDASAMAAKEALASGLFYVEHGTATNLSAPNGAFDLVILGFLMYLVDPEDYFRIASEVDRVLMNRGHLLIHDLISNRPFARIYEHDTRLYSHHFDPSKLWLAHPAYKEIEHAIKGEEGVVLLRKNMDEAFPMEGE